VRLLPLLALCGVSLIQMVHCQLEFVIRVHQITAQLLLEVFQVLDFAFLDDAFAFETRVEFDLLRIARLDSGAHFFEHALVVQFGIFVLLGQFFLLSCNSFKFAA